MNCTEVLAVRQDEDRLLIIDNFILSKSYVIGDGSERTRFLSLQCPENSQTYSSDAYKCQMVALTEEGDTIFFIEF